MVQSMLRYLVEFDFGLQQRLFYVAVDKAQLGRWSLRPPGVVAAAAPEKLKRRRSRRASDSAGEEDSLLSGNG